jgi:[acyl-carrier-protein] S-malonyltransferase
MYGFVFPGQGSQRVGMGEDLARSFSVAKEVFERADDALGFSLSELCFNGPAEQLMMTANSQPAILTTSIAALRVMEAESQMRPSIVAGHSLGEYSALVCANAVSFEDAVRAVNQRGRFMQEAVPVGQGAMAAVIGLTVNQVHQLCDEAAQGDVLHVANYNSPEQTVIAGDTAAINRAVALAIERNAYAATLPVSAPFHGPLMSPAATRLKTVLEEIKWSVPTVPVVANVDAMPNTDAARIVELLVNQVTQPVRWIDCVNRMVEAGATEIVEIGFGQTLSQLIRYINSEVSVLSIGTEEELRATCTSSSEGEAQTESQFDDGRKVMADGRIVWPDGMTWDPNEPGAHGF